MRVEISPGKAAGKVSAPPSKSMTHRYLICAALSEGESRIENVGTSQDILATMDCLEALGAELKREQETVYVKGISFNGGKEEMDLRVRESGSTLRFFIPIVWGFGKTAHVYGSETLFTRPLSVYEEIAEKQGLVLDKSAEEILVSGTLKPGEFQVPGNISSQFISGLLFILPLLGEDSRILFTTEVESRSYLDLTVQALRSFGITIDFSEKEIRIPGNQKYRPREIRVEGDYSNAAFLEGLNVLGGNVQVEDLSKSSLQGDRVYQELFKELQKGFARIDLSDCPDLGPVLFALASALKGAEFLGTRRLKIKESDRGAVMCAELKKFGVESREEENKISVFASELKKPKEDLDGHNDHRIVMALSLLLTLTGGSIAGSEAVAKSFPDYFERIQSLGIEVVKYGLDS